MCCPLVFEFSVGIGGFVIGLGQISFFFSFSGLHLVAPDRPVYKQIALCLYKQRAICRPPGMHEADCSASYTGKMKL